MASDNITVKNILLPAIVAGLVTLVVNFCDLNIKDYKEYKSKHQPRLDLIDYTGNESPPHPFSRNKDIFFNVAIRKAHITKIKLKVVEKKQGNPIYEMILFEGGGGGGGDMPQCYTASANIDNTTNEYVLIDMPNSINKFRKENMPAPVFFSNDFDNFFYKISIYSKERSFECAVITEIEWKGVYKDEEDNNDIKVLEIGPHKYFFLNPIELKSTIPATTKIILVNGFSRLKRKISLYLNGMEGNSRPEIIFTENYQGKFIMLDNDRIFYMNEEHSHGEFLYFDEKPNFISMSRT